MGFAQKILLSLSVFLTASCSTTHERPPVDIKFWFGNPQKAALVREPYVGEKEQVACTSPKFNDYIAMSKNDFINFYTNIIMGCTAWKKKGVQLTPDEEAVLKEALGED